jgi:pentatricopeptide repeat protein
MRSIYDEIDTAMFHGYRVTPSLSIAEGVFLANESTQHMTVNYVDLIDVFSKAGMFHKACSLIQQYIDLKYCK